MINMKTNIALLESDVTRIRAEVATAYNAHRDAVDRLFNAERELAAARKNGDD